MLCHKKHTKFIANKKIDGTAVQNDIVLNVTEVAELLGRDEQDVAEILRELHDDVTIVEDR